MRSRAEDAESMGKLSGGCLGRRDPYLGFIDCLSILSRANRCNLPLYKRLYNYILASLTDTEDYNGVLLCGRSERDVNKTGLFGLPGQRA